MIGKRVKSWFILFLVVTILSFFSQKGFAKKIVLEEYTKIKPSPAYEKSIKPLTTEECARCHSWVFNRIKEKGGKHRIDCTWCHVKFHVYNPIKKNWAEIMPKCTRCHGYIHGKLFTNCLGCHKDPHAPRIVGITPEVGKACGQCHPNITKELNRYPSKHTTVACVACHHTKHGYIPSCLECHKPHYPNEPVKECFNCHAPHSPLRILQTAFPKETLNKVCSPCHKVEFEKIARTPSKHHKVACVQCHVKHKDIPKCERCHGKPHGAGVHQKFPNCLDCHMDVHNLPVKTGTK